MGELCPAEPHCPLWMRISLRRNDLLGEESRNDLLGVANLSEKGLEPVPQWAFIGFNLHRNTGGICKPHQSWSVSNDQTIDNIQRTLRAYSESGSVS